MAAELEKLAQQFSLTGNNDIAKGVQAWAEVARERGLETFETGTPKKKIFVFKGKKPLVDMVLIETFEKRNLESPRVTMTPEQMEEAAGLPHRSNLETEAERRAYLERSMK
jgi:hypothetical protein